MRNVALRIVLFARPRDRAGRVRRMRSAANADGGSGFAGKGGSAAGGAGGAVGGAGGAVGGAGRGCRRRRWECWWRRRECWWRRRECWRRRAGTPGRRRRNGGARRERGRRRGRRCGGRCGRTRRERRRPFSTRAISRAEAASATARRRARRVRTWRLPSCPISESNAVCGGHCCLPTVASDGGSGDAGPSSYTCGAGSCTTGQTFCYSYFPGSPGGSSHAFLHDAPRGVRGQSHLRVRLPALELDRHRVHLRRRQPPASLAAAPIPTGC